MLYGKDNQEEKNYLEPIFGSASEDVDLPKYKFNRAFPSSNISSCTN